MWKKCFRQHVLFYERHHFQHFNFSSERLETSIDWTASTELIDELVFVFLNLWRFIWTSYRILERKNQIVEMVDDIKT